ncbi:MAG: ceramidase domain-containing protein, partial [Gammaproteobacteria bacterium]
MNFDTIRRYGVPVVLLLLAASVLLGLPPIAQDPSYHQFADQRRLFGIDHFFNVVSNVPFVIVGALGLADLYRSPLRGVLIGEMLAAYRLFFFGVALVGIGSAYYHLAPSNATLVFDRLPMTIAFMAFFTVILAEYVSVPKAKALLYPLLILGIFSVVYWHFSEQSGHGDLRLYGLVQFLPLAILPVILTFYPARFSHGSYYWLFFGCYALAKAFEHFDTDIY